MAREEPHPDGMRLCGIKGFTVTNTTIDHELGPEPIHRNWDNSRPPVLSIDSGQVVRFTTYGVGEGWLTPDATPDVLVGRKFTGHPLTGPVAIHDAKPGDTFQID